MPGILNFQRYLDTLQTLTELGNTFPGEQRTYTYDVAGSGTQGWTATISWMTLIVDQYQIDRNNRPDFANSTVLGYYAGGSTAEYSTGTISFPKDMYTGPILPSSLTNTPITVVNISWIKNSTTYDVNLALIQNWTPGVRIGDPYGGIGFEPIYGEPATLTLSGTTTALVGGSLNYVATSDIPIEIGPNNPCYLYLAPNTLLSTVNMVGNTATFAITASAPISTGTNQIYAVFGGVGNYQTAVSNTLTLTVLTAIPLEVVSEQFQPNKAYYEPGDNLAYTITMRADPAYPPSGYPINNDVIIYSRTVFSPFTQQPWFQGSFSNSTATATISILNGQIDYGLSNPNSTFTVTGYTTNTTVLTATIEISNTLTIKTMWDSLVAGNYGGGEYNRTIDVRGTDTRTITIEDFPLTLTVSSARQIYLSPLTITVGTVSTPYSRLISIYGLEQSTTTQTLIYQVNASGQTSISTTTSSLSTGTWTIYASYPGDFGDSLSFANRPSSSNTASYVVTPGNDLDVEIEFIRTVTNDIIRVTGNTSTTLTNAVSFFNGVTSLGTASWVRATTQSIITITDPAFTFYTAPPSIIYKIGTQTNVINQSGTTSFSPNQRALYEQPGYQTSASTNAYTGGLGQVTAIYTSTQFRGDEDTYLSLPVQRERSTDLDNMQSWYNPFGYRYNTSVPRDQILLAPNSTQDYFIFGQGGYSTQLASQNKAYMTAPYTNYQVALNSQAQGNLRNIGTFNPNVYRAWRYYDGTNYNLNTSTAFEDCLDPISTGTWQVQFQRSFTSTDLTYVPLADRNMRMFDMSRVYEDSINNYQWDLYDIYRIDTIGDPRGYNVVGLNAEMYQSRPEVSTSSPRTVQFPSSASFPQTNYAIDLVEFIGTITQAQPTQSLGEYQAGSTGRTKTIWLYRFTPEMPASSERTFKTYLPLAEHFARIPGITYQAGRATRIPISTLGTFRMPSDAPLFANTYCQTSITGGGQPPNLANWGRLQWTSNQVYNSVTNYTADMANWWYRSFITNWNPQQSSSTWYDVYTYRPYVEPRTTTTQITTATTLQTATYVTSAGSLDISQIMRATWPGTVELDPEYGDFNSFDIQTLGQTGISISLQTYAKPSDSSTTQSPSFYSSSTVISNYNSLIARVAVQNPLTGNITIKNTAGTVLKTTTVTSTSSHNFDLTISDLTGVSTGTSTYSVLAEFQDTVNNQTLTSTSVMLTTFKDVSYTIINSQDAWNQRQITGAAGILIVGYNYPQPFGTNYNTNKQWQFTAQTSLRMPTLFRNPAITNATYQYQLPIALEFYIRYYNNGRPILANFIVWNDSNLTTIDPRGSNPFVEFNQSWLSQVSLPTAWQNQINQTPLSGGVYQLLEAKLWIQTTALEQTQIINNQAINSTERLAVNLGWDPNTMFNSRFTLV